MRTRVRATEDIERPLIMTTCPDAGLRTTTLAGSKRRPEETRVRNDKRPTLLKPTSRLRETQLVAIRLPLPRKKHSFPECSFHARLSGNSSGGVELVRMGVFGRLSLFGSGLSSIEGVGDGSSPDVQRAGEAADRALGVARRGVGRRGGAAEQVLGDVGGEVARSVHAGRHRRVGGLGARGPSTREAQLERELAEVTSALGEAHVELRLLKREGAGFTSRSWR